MVFRYDWPEGKDFLQDFLYEILFIRILRIGAKTEHFVDLCIHGILKIAVEDV